MSQKYTYSKLTYTFIVLFEAMTIALATFMPNMENKLYLIMLFCLYVFYLKRIGLENRKSLLIVHLLILTFVAWSIINIGIGLTVHLDFYAYVGFSITLVIFTNKDILCELKGFLNNNVKLVELVSAVYFVVLAISIVICNGLRVGFNMSIPILYGPYSIPHDVAYECLFLYCLNGYMYKVKKTRIFLLFKAICLVCVMWTATRSAFLAMAIVVFIDYCGYKDRQKKVAVMLLGIFALMYIAFFTDFLVTNPIVQKTIAAVRDTGTVSNGRSHFTDVAIFSYRHNTNLFQKILGMGIEGVRTSLKADPLIKVAIHAHNDYVNVLCGYGIVGFIIMIVQQIKLMTLWKKKTYGLLAQAVLVALLFTNGLAMYCIVTPLLPVFFIFVQECGNRKKRLI